jgi:hypothetical protein
MQATQGRTMSVQAALMGGYMASEHLDGEVTPKEDRTNVPSASPS